MCRISNTSLSELLIEGPDVGAYPSIAGPWITEKEIRYVTEAVASGWYENSAKYQGEFETAFAAFTGRRYGLALPSCTSGLHPLEFLLKPLQEQIARTFRER